MDSICLFLNLVDNAMSWSWHACSFEREQTLELGRLGLEPKEPLDSCAVLKKKLLLTWKLTLLTFKLKVSPSFL